MEANLKEIYAALDQEKSAVNTLKVHVDDYVQDKGKSILLEIAAFIRNKLMEVGFENGCGYAYFGYQLAKSGKRFIFYVPHSGALSTCKPVFVVDQVGTSILNSLTSSELHSLSYYWKTFKTEWLIRLRAHAKIQRESISKEMCNLADTLKAIENFEI